MLVRFSPKSDFCAAGDCRYRVQALFFILLVSMGSTSWAQSESQPTRELEDETDLSQAVYSLMKTRCFSCHGPEASEGGLRLDRPADFEQGGDHGPLGVTLEETREWLLVQVIRGIHEELEQMPPEGEGTPLSDAEVKLVERWLSIGAPFPAESQGGTEQPDLWSLQAPQAAPRVPQPTSNWSRHAIDRFVITRLGEVGVEPAPRADRATLVKRVYLDLLGLLPPPEVALSFMEDATPGAYEKMVDRVLSSPHFGERWGRHWLDAARYADSDGYEKDRPRPHAWRYREWVIDAINRDLSYRDFSIQQIAGDLLPQAASDVFAATGFHRNTLHNTEGGTDQEEDRVKKTVDRTNTVGSLWLGMTVGCAQCHTHKYDPITQREYFQLYAFFNQIDEHNTPATLPRDQIEILSELDRWSLQGEELGRLKREAELEVQLRFDEWLNSSPNFPIWSTLSESSAESKNGTILERLVDGSWLARGPNEAAEVYEIHGNLDPGHSWTAMRLEVLPHDTLPKGGPGRADNGNFVLTDLEIEVLRAGGRPEKVTVEKAYADFSQTDWQAEKSINDQPDDGWAVSPHVGQRHFVIYEFSEPVTLLEGARVMVRLKQKYPGKSHNLGHFRISLTNSTDFFPGNEPRGEWVKQLAGSTNLSDLASLAPLLRYFRLWDPKFREIQSKVEQHQARKPKLQGAEVQAVIERSKPRETRVHLRGDFLNPGVRVTAAVPRVFPDLEITEGSPSRLDFAEWLFRDGHPTTARTEVNRIWLRLFGEGLVRSPEDFGTQGDLPTHAELLDWLSVEFQRLGWSRKRLIRTILLSETYQQSSAVRPELWTRDPENKWLARQNRLRLEAEVIRDISLQASGLLDETVGGPSVRPPQPKGYNALTYANSAKWEESQGGDAHRRGLYTFFQRTSPYPMLMTFDCPDANQSVVMRNRSNTPLQALTLWNERVFFQCHQAMAGEVLAEWPDSATDASKEFQRSRLNWCVARTLGRPLTFEEEETFLHLYEATKSRLLSFPAGSEDLEALIGGQHLGQQRADLSGQRSNELKVELATWILICRTLMNLDEFISRE